MCARGVAGCSTHPGLHPPRAPPTWGPTHQEPHLPGTPPTQCSTHQEFHTLGPTHPEPHPPEAPPIQRPTHRVLHSLGAPPTQCPTHPEFHPPGTPPTQSSTHLCAPQLLSESQGHMAHLVNSVSDVLDALQRDRGLARPHVKADLQRAPARGSRPRGCANGE